jgi:hypothetical protein
LDPALQKGDGAWGQQEAAQARAKLIRRNRRQHRPFADWELMRAVQQPGDSAGVFRAITWVIALRSDSLPEGEGERG